MRPRTPHGPALPPAARLRPDVPRRPGRRGPRRRRIWSHALWDVRKRDRQRDGRHGDPARASSTSTAARCPPWREDITSAAGTLYGSGVAAQVRAAFQARGILTEVDAGGGLSGRLPAIALRTGVRMANAGVRRLEESRHPLRSKESDRRESSAARAVAATDIGGGRMASLKIGDTAPDFEADTTEGDLVPRLDRRLLGRAVLAPEGLHAGVHDRARLHGEDQAGVRPSQREDHRPLRRLDRRPRGMGARHRGDAGHGAELPDHRGCRLRASRSCTGCSAPTSPAIPATGRQPTTRRSATCS